MIQFHNANYWRHDLLGIINMGTWLLAYRLRRVSGICCSALEPLKITLTGKYGGRVISPAVRFRKAAPHYIMDLGEKTYSCNTGLLENSHTVLAHPGPRQRINCTRIFEIKTQDTTVPKWLITGAVQWDYPGRSSVYAGKRGGLSFWPRDVVNTGSGYVHDRLFVEVFNEVPLMFWNVCVRMGPHGVMYGASHNRMFAFLPNGGPGIFAKMLYVEGGITDFDFSPDGKYVAMATWRAVKELTNKYESGVSVYAFEWPNFTLVKEYTWPAHMLSWSEDGSTIAVLGHDSRGEKHHTFLDTVTVFDVEV